MSIFKQYKTSVPRRVDILHLYYYVGGGSANGCVSCMPTSTAIIADNLHAKAGICLPFPYTHTPECVNNNNHHWWECSHCHWLCGIDIDSSIYYIFRFFIVFFYFLFFGFAVNFYHEMVWHLHDTPYLVYNTDQWWCEDHRNEPQVSIEL